MHSILLAVRYEAGQLIWTQRAGQRGAPGSIAGGVRNGYVVVNFQRTAYQAHRVIWAIHHGGVLPDVTLEIDHINGVRHDNRIENLRLVTKAQNQQNRHAARSDSRIGFLGVRKIRKNWGARISVNGVRTHIGVFDTPQAAHEAYLVAKRKLHSTCSI